MVLIATEHDKQRAEADNLIPLFCRALSRLAVAAHGIDARLDELLAELRQLLRRDIDDQQQLAQLIDTIDARIKHVDDARDDHAQVVQQSLQKLIEQMLALKPDSDLSKELKASLKQLKHDITEEDQLRLLKRLPILHGRVLHGLASNPAGGGLLSRWFFRSGETAAVSGNPIESEPELQSASIIAPVAVVPDSIVCADFAVKGPNEIGAGSADDSNAGPAFTRISTAVCEVLDDLLKQIVPPPSVSDNYRLAREQIVKGLNWYELVSTLEQISVIVLASLKRDQGEFREFLQGINQRLGDAHNVLESSRLSQSQRAQADATLNDRVRCEVAEIQVSVQTASQLDDLKHEVALRLESVVGALDVHRSSEALRQRELEQQLTTLTARLQEMELQSQAIEGRLVEQQRLALLDMLTQLPNRQAYEQRLLEEYERWKRYARPLALAVCDIDNFKSINDTFGHLAGDKVLRIIARTLTQRLRKTDFIARFGGEEFVILMPETDRQGALQIIEAIREAVASCPFHFRDEPLSITLSAGIAEFADTTSPEAIFERADTALYQAKQNGRNRCAVAA